MGWDDFMTAKKELADSQRVRLSDYAEVPAGLGQLDQQGTSRAMAALNRGAIAGTLGAPVDLVNTGLQAFGIGSERPVLGSEWIGDRMHQAGIVPAQRDPAAELAAGFVDPLSGAGSALKLAKGLPAVAGIFGGKNAKLADMEGLLKAEQLLKNGHDPAAVWKETGWGVGPDGKWRFEIPDDEFLTTPMKLNTFYPGVDKVIDHPEFFNQYPDAGQIGLTASKNPGGKYFSGDGPDRIVVDYKDEGDTIIHELQHAVQEREGFAKGGNTQEFIKQDSPYPPEITPFADAYATLWRSMKGDPDRPKVPVGLHDRGRDLDEWYDSVEKISDPVKRKQFTDILGEIEVARDKVFGVNNGLITQLSAEEQYRRLGGEAEARLTQSRLNLTPQERLAQYPWEPDYFKQATGVPLDKLINR